MKYAVKYLVANELSLLNEEWLEDIIPKLLQKPEAPSDQSCKTLLGR